MIARLLAFIPSSALWWVIGAAFAGLTAFSGAQVVRVASAQKEAAQAREALATAISEHAEAVVAQNEVNRLKSKVIANVREKEIHDANVRAQASQADAVASRAAGVRLRDQLAQEFARRLEAAGNRPASPGGPPADTAPDLLALVQRRLDEATDGVADFADASHGAGLACERISAAVTQ